MKSKKVLLVGAVLCVVLLVTVYAVVINERVVEHSGMIGSTDFEIFSDSNCTIPLELLEWGSLVKGHVYSRTGYIKHSVDHEDIYLYWIYANLPPSLTIEMAFDGVEWIDGQADKKTLLIGETKQITFKLTVADYADGDFTFWTTIIGETV